MTGPWQPEKPDHRDPRQDEASRLWAAQQRHRGPDALESAQVTGALIVAAGFMCGVVAGILAAAFILGAF